MRAGLSALRSPTRALLQNPAVPTAAMQQTHSFGEAAKHLLTIWFAKDWIFSSFFYYFNNEIRTGRSVPLVSVRAAATSSLLSGQHSFQSLNVPPYVSLI